MAPRRPNVLASLAEGVLLPVVRRRPLTGATALLMVACLQSVVLASLPETVSFLLTGLLLALLVGMAGSLRRAVVGLVIVAGGVVAMHVITSGPRHTDGLVPSLALGLLAWWGGRALSRRAARTRELRVIADELARTQGVQTQLAAAQARAAIARELHDVGAHALTAVCLQANAARTWWHRDPQRARQATQAIQELAAGPLSALGASLNGLASAPRGVELLEVGAGLGRVLGLEVQIVVVGAPRDLADDVAAVAARVIQEALTNVARHAGSSTVTITIRWTPDSVQVGVRDTGPDGTSPAVGLQGAGLGLRGIRERVETAQGALVAGPVGSGFEIHATIPA